MVVGALASDATAVTMTREPGGGGESTAEQMVTELRRHQHVWEQGGVAR
jgi:hypothetical protein